LKTRAFRTYATLAVLLLALGGMTTLVSYSVTLYRLFCAVTGAGGTTQRVAADTAAISDKTVTVFFNTDVAPGLPWKFRPVADKVTVHLGEQTPVFFEAENLSNEDIVGHATFNVTPDKAGLYFKKIQCFCFTEERLGAHQTVEMPVLFYVDPELGTNPGTADVHQITLSYTFFRSEKPDGAADLARFDNAPPDPERGEKLFAAQCGACHELDHTKIGPALGGVIGRPAGTVAGYSYSTALAHATLVWSAPSLDQWLASPQKMIPGVAMPVAVADPATRRDIIAYLALAKS
jgi:cytochrome c oxidase assembly protein Cox11